MVELVTSAQMRAIEQAAIALGEVTGLTLMERAGEGVVAAIFEEWPQFQDEPHRAVVLCGPGNNGGDGFVIARLLLARGWAVDVFLYGDPDKLPPDAKVNYERWVAMGSVSPLESGSIEEYEAKHPDARLAVDALFGTGLTRKLRGLDGVEMGLNGWQVRCVQGVAPFVVAVDCPSGLSLDTGLYPGFDAENPFDSCAMANLTVTFHRPRLGHYLGYGPSACGRLVVVDIGLTIGGYTTVLVEPPHKSLVAKFGHHHKYSYGHALILSGPVGRTGAARLAARAALRVGAGLVTVATPHDALAENAAQLTAIMLREVDAADALAQLLEDDRLNALCIGPGLGFERVRELVPEALRSERACVLDADALSAFSGDPDTLFNMLHDNCVLTPHGGEFAQLFPDIAAKFKKPAANGLAYSKVDATREAAARAGCTVLFKGVDTVIANQTGNVAIHTAAYDRTAPWLATAGSGDVLAGLIVGLLARGLAPVKAAQVAAWLHTEAARSFGPGLIAEDLPDQIPQVFRNLNV